MAGLVSMSRFTSDFKSKISHGLRCGLWVLVCTLVFFAPYEYAFTDTSPAMIDSVRVLVDQQPGGEDVDKLIAIRPGDTFSFKKINYSIKQIYKTGLFEDVQVLKEGEASLALTFLLTSRPFSRTVTIVGGDNLPQRKLKGQIYSLREGDPYSQDKLDRAIAELQRALIRDGYFDSEITASTEKVEGTTQVDVFLNIQSATSYVVDNVIFEGRVILPAEKLINVMKTRNGRQFIPADLDEDIEKLQEIYVKEDYRRAEVLLKNQEFHKEFGSVALTLEIIPHEKIVIDVRGAKVPLDIIRPLWEAQIFEEWGLNEGEAKITGYMRQKGYLYVTVTSQIDERDNEIRIIHDVTPGEKVGLMDIDFQGLTYFSSEEIKKQLALDVNIPLLNRIDGARIFELPVEIQFLYKTQGFPETRVDLRLERYGNKVKPIYVVEEGRQETIAEIRFAGSSMYALEELLAELSSVPGGPYYQPTVQQDIEKLYNFYLNEGVRGMDIRAAVQAVADDQYALTFQIREGSKVQIEDIVITGYHATRIGTINRELRIHKGDYARYGDIRETKRRLERLGIFSEVKIEEIQLTPDRMNLFIILSEGDRNYVSAGLGLETAGQPYTFDVWNYDVRLRATGELIRGNIFGTAAQISLVGQLSIREKRIVASWQQPYFFKLPLETFLSGWWEQEDRTSFQYERRGVSLSGVRTFRSKEFWTLITALRYARTEVLDLRIEESEIDRQFFPYSTTSLSLSAIRDRRSDPFNPAQGYFFSTALEWAYPLFGAESDFLKLFTKYQHYFPVYKDVGFIFTGRLGLGEGKMPIPERFFAGGSNSFRGTRYDILGPKDPKTDRPIGGKALLLFNFELTFPVTTKIPYLYAALFYDKGNVWAERDKLSLADLEDTLGLGLRYRTPLGPVRLELGWNPNVPEGNSGILVFMTIGNIF